VQCEPCSQIRLSGLREMWSRSQGRRTVCRALCVLRASERATGNSASVAQDCLVPEEACRVLWLARQRQKALDNTEYRPLGIIHSASIKPPPGLVYVVPSSMKQISRQRLSPDLQDMKSSSGGGETGSTTAHPRPARWWRTKPLLIRRCVCLSVCCGRAEVVVSEASPRKGGRLASNWHWGTTVDGRLTTVFEVIITGEVH
jgi:hypothetical protein